MSADGATSAYANPVDGHHGVHLVEQRTSGKGGWYSLTSHQAGAFTRSCSTSPCGASCQVSAIGSTPALQLEQLTHASIQMPGRPRSAHASSGAPAQQQTTAQPPQMYQSRPYPTMWSAARAREVTERRQISAGDPRCDRGSLLFTVIGMAEVRVPSGTCTFDGDLLRIVLGDDRRARTLRQARGELAVPASAIAGVTYSPGRHAQLRLRLREGADPFLQIGGQQIRERFDPYRLLVPTDAGGAAEYLVDEVRNALTIEQVPASPTDHYLVDAPAVPLTTRADDGIASFDGSHLRLEWTRWRARHPAAATARAGDDARRRHPHRRGVHSGPTGSSSSVLEFAAPD